MPTLSPLIDGRPWHACAKIVSTREEGIISLSKTFFVALGITSGLVASRSLADPTALERSAQKKSALDAAPSIDDKLDECTDLYVQGQRKAARRCARQLEQALSVLVMLERTYDIFERATQKNQEQYQSLCLGRRAETPHQSAVCELHRNANARQLSQAYELLVERFRGSPHFRYQEVSLAYAKLLGLLQISMDSYRIAAH